VKKLFRKISTHARAKLFFTAILFQGLLMLLVFAPDIFGQGTQTPGQEPARRFVDSDKPFGWEYVEDGKVYTAYSATEDLGNGKKAATIYSAPEFIREDGVLKNKRDANSLRGYYEPLRLHDDGIHDIEYVDWNWDRVQFKVKLRDVPEADSLKNVEIPVKIDGVIDRYAAALDRSCAGNRIEPAMADVCAAIVKGMKFSIIPSDYHHAQGQSAFIQSQSAAWLS
jgi:hypothetical protein